MQHFSPKKLQITLLHGLLEISIIDEISMFGRKMFEQIDYCLQQALSLAGNYCIAGFFHRRKFTQI